MGKDLNIVDLGMVLNTVMEVEVALEEVDGHDAVKVVCRRL